MKAAIYPWRILKIGEFKAMSNRRLLKFKPNLNMMVVVTILLLEGETIAWTAWTC